MVPFLLIMMTMKMVVMMMLIMILTRCFFHENLLSLFLLCRSSCYTAAFSFFSQVRALKLAVVQQHGIPLAKIGKFLIAGENLTVSSASAPATIPSALS